VVFSTTAPSCSVAPIVIVTIADSTASETLTLITAKSQWDFFVHVSTGVGTIIFKPNGTITVSKHGVDLYDVTNQLLGVV